MLPPQIFIRTRDWPSFHSAHPNGDGVPQNFWLLKFKIWPKIQCISPYSFGASGCVLTTRWRDELWSTNKKVARILTHRRCSYTVSGHTPRVSMIQCSESFVSSHCCERTFDYLNWLSTWTCGVGQPHIGLCPILLVKNNMVVLRVTFKSLEMVCIYVAVCCHLTVVQKNQSNRGLTKQWTHQEKWSCISQMFHMRWSGRN